MSKEDIVKHYKIDTQRMLDRVMSLPEQVEDAWALAGEFDFEPSRKDGPVIICGMGGSGIGGRLLIDLMGQEGTKPVVLESSYTLPAFADENTPVICISYSGNTEEVLSCFSHAMIKGCPTAVITSGGKLEEEAGSSGVPILKIPGGMPPRAAIAYLFVPLVRIFSRWGFYEVSDDYIDLAVRKLRKLANRYSLEGDPAENLAMELAKKLYGKIPVIYAGNGLLNSIAYRWKCQFNENSKVMAFSNAFPELGHNEVMGWDCPERLREDMFIIMLNDVEDHPRVQKRMEITYGMLSTLGAGGISINSEGENGREGRLTRMFSMLVLGDFVSVYLAVSYGKDPTPIEKISRIKDELGSM